MKKNRKDPWKASTFQKRHALLEDIERTIKNAQHEPMGMWQKMLLLERLYQFATMDKNYVKQQTARRIEGALDFWMDAVGPREENIGEFLTSRAVHHLTHAPCLERVMEKGTPILFAGGFTTYDIGRILECILNSLGRNSERQLAFLKKVHDISYGTEEEEAGRPG